MYYPNVLTTEAILICVGMLFQSPCYLNAIGERQIIFPHCMVVFYLSTDITYV